MRFKTIGNPDDPRALFIHAMFTDSESFSALAEYLIEDYFVIMPTLDGHDTQNENSDFISYDDEADKILAYLQEMGIKELDFILGTSLGAIIAFEVYRGHKVHINKVFLDGGPFFNFGSLLQKIMMKKFWSICSKTRQNPGFAAIKIDKLFPGLGSQMCHVCCHMSKKSVSNLAHACYSYSLPELGEAEQKAITFIYGTKEPALMCSRRLKKYKYSSFIRKAGYSHCGYLLSHPDEYAEMLKESPHNLNQG
ncbi:MAG: alpha/beta hydrolase [Bacillota bacterium]|nr:alpha/beta hydrolase [Bacillota bacterium]